MNQENSCKISRLNMVSNLATLLGLVDVALLLTWIFKFENGLHWKNPVDRFNFHPTLMVIGFVYVHGQAILVFRRLRGVHKLTLKIIHGLFHALIIAAIVFAVKAVFDSKDYAVPRQRNAYSVHSWLGMGTIGLYLSQFLFGFLTFLLPGMSNSLKNFYHPVHTKLGAVIFMGTIVTALMGIEGYTNGIKNYKTLTTEAIVVNCTGVVLVIYGALILFLVNHEDYKRIPQEEERPLLLAASEDNHS